MTFTPETIGIIALFIVLAAGAYFYQNKKTGTAKLSLYSYTKDLSRLAETGALDPVTGREEELERMIHILKRRSKNNPLLIGQPGVGKTALAEALAQAIADKNVPAEMQSKRILVLDLTSLMSGSKYRGELEERIDAIMKEIEMMQGRAILFIDEIHLIESMGGTEGALTISDVLKPALARGEMQVIGATTWAEYKEFIAVDQALDRRFQPVLVDEPSAKEALEILKAIRPQYEAFHRVKISDEALAAAVSLSDKKITKRYLPDKAIDLMDEAAAKVSIESTSVHYAHRAALHGAAKAAAKKSSGKAKDATVDAADIKDVVDQWLIHSKEEKKRDARV